MIALRPGRLVGQVGNDKSSNECSGGLVLTTARSAGRNMVDQSRAMEHFLASIEKQAYQMAVIAVSNRDEALDLVQDAMLALVRHYSAKEEAQWRPLFFRILQSRIRDWYRRDRVRQRWLFAALRRRPATQGPPDSAIQSANRPVKTGVF